MVKSKLPFFAEDGSPCAFWICSASNLALRQSPLRTDSLLSHFFVSSRLPTSGSLRTIHLTLPCLALPCHMHSSWSHGTRAPSALSRLGRRTMRALFQLRATSTAARAAGRYCQSLPQYDTLCRSLIPSAKTADEEPITCSNQLWLGASQPAVSLQAFQRRYFNL